MSDDDCGEGGDESDGAGIRCTPDGGFSDVDALLDALSHSRRRYVLYFLRDEQTATLDEVARRIAAWERGVPLEAVSADDDAEAVRAALYHKHLPVLADAMLVEYDDRSEALRYRNPPKVLEPLLWILERVDDPRTEP